METGKRTSPRRGRRERHDRSALPSGDPRAPGLGLDVDPHHLAHHRQQHRGRLRPSSAASPTATSRSSAAPTTSASGSSSTCSPMRRSPTTSTTAPRESPPGCSPGTPALEGLQLSKLHPFEVTTERRDEVRLLLSAASRVRSRRRRQAVTLRSPPWCWCTADPATSAPSGPTAPSCTGWPIAATRCSTSTTAARRASASG